MGNQPNNRYYNSLKEMKIKRFMYLQELLLTQP